MRKKYLLIIILLIILAGFFIQHYFSAKSSAEFSYRVKIKNLWLEMTKKELSEAMEFQSNDENKTKRLDDLKTEEQISNSTNAPRRVYADSLNLDVPFTSQAPHANWNETFKEGCEEASALMIDYFYQGKEFTTDIATDEILKMVDWQMDYFGGHFDLTAKQTAEMIKKYWNYERVEVINNPTINDIKMHISEQRPVIVPAAGRVLGNPYFRQPSPIYHMLVIKGYTEDKFITNDPGTKRGEDFLYDYDVLMNAIHDWNEQNILQGEKRIIVIYPN